MIDSEPDRFYYKLANQGGAFGFGIRYPNNNHTPEICGVYTCPFVSVQISGWEVFGKNGLNITDENGIWYEFGSESDGYTERTGDYNTR